MPRSAPTHRPAGQPEKRQDYRRSASDRGYGTRWTRFAAQYRKANPLCIACLAKDIATAATVVDHIIPLHVRPDLQYEESNLQPLCRACHAVKTHRDVKKYGSAQ